jgi:hypothetical protein
VPSGDSGSSSTAASTDDTSALQPEAPSGSSVRPAATTSAGSSPILGARNDSQRTEASSAHWTSSNSNSTGHSSATFDSSHQSPFKVAKPVAQPAPPQCRTATQPNQQLRRTSACGWRGKPERRAGRTTGVQRQTRIRARAGCFAPGAPSARPPSRARTTLPAAASCPSRHHCGRRSPTPGQRSHPPPQTRAKPALAHAPANPRYGQALSPP